MLIRSLLVLIALAAAAGTASAQTPTDRPVPGVAPGACMDPFRPVARLAPRAARTARRTHRLRGTARDRGCGVDRVRISVARKAGRRCRQLTSARRLTRPTRCAHRRWLRVRGTASWSFRLPKRLPRGTYVIRLRAVDFAGNRQHPRARRLHLR